jgi:hypothetical protein
MGMVWEAFRQRRRPRPRSMALAGVTLAAVVFCAGSALGAGRLKTESVRVNVAAQDLGLGVAICDPGTKAVSGGFETESEPEGPTPTPVFQMVESARRGAGRWQSIGENIGGAAGHLTTFAYCRDLKLERAAATAAAGPGHPTTATAKCPRGTKVFSGGFEVAEDQGIVSVTSSKRVGKRKWAVGSPNLQFNGSGDLKARAYCHEGKALAKKRATQTVSQNTKVQVEAKCGRGTRVVAGGFDAFEDDDLAAPFVTGSRKRGGRRWVVDVVAANDATVTAFAYCEKASD